MSATPPDPPPSRRAARPRVALDRAPAAYPGMRPVAGGLFDNFTRPGLGRQITAQEAAGVPDGQAVAPSGAGLTLGGTRTFLAAAEASALRTRRHYFKLAASALLRLRWRSLPAAWTGFWAHQRLLKVLRREQSRLKG